MVRRLPGLEQLRHYERGWLSVDLLAGLTVGAMLVPQGMAYAELADMPPVTGFYAALLALDRVRVRWVVSTPRCRS